MKILAFDPGKNDFAWAHINSNGKVGSDHGFVRTITTMEFSKLPDELYRFTTDIEKLFDRYGIGGDSPGHAMVVERMQHRPKMGGGAVVEYINVMIGLLFGIAHRRRVNILAVSPALWKNHMRKVYGLQKKDLFTMATQQLTVKAPKGKTRKLHGADVQCKTTSVLVEGVLAAQPGHESVTTHEADAIGIGCYCWSRVTGIEIVKSVLT